MTEIVETVRLVMMDDGDAVVEAPVSCVSRCGTLSNAADMGCSRVGTGGRDAIPVPNVDAATMRLVVEFVKLMDAWPEVCDGADLHDRERDFDEALGAGAETRRRLMEAATFLDFPRLLESQARLFAERIEKCGTVEDVREVLGVENDFSEKEEAEMRGMLLFAFL